MGTAGFETFIFTAVAAVAALGITAATAFVTAVVAFCVELCEDCDCCCCVGVVNVGVARAVAVINAGDDVAVGVTTVDVVADDF